MMKPMPRMPIALPLAVLFVLACFPARADESDTPIRNGLTLEAGLGGSFVSELPSTADPVSHQLGRDSVSVGAGYFLTPRLSLMLRFSMTSFKPESEYEANDASSLWFLGAHVQLWFTERFFVSGGPGYVHYDHVLTAVYGTELHDQYQNVGFSLRTGFAFAVWENHTLRVALEVIPAFFERTTLVGESLSLEWQWF